MADDEQPTTESPQEEAPKGGVGGLFYKLALAGVGGVMLAQEELGNLLRRDSGAAQGEGEGEAPAPEAPAAEAAPAPEASDEPEASDDPEASDESEGDAQGEGSRFDFVDGTINRVLRSLSVPSRAELAAFSEQVEGLAARIEAFARTRPGGE